MLIGFQLSFNHGCCRVRFLDFYIKEGNKKKKKMAEAHMNLESSETCLFDISQDNPLAITALVLAFGLGKTPITWMALLNSGAFMPTIFLGHFLSFLKR
jgi:hypothetical protein